MSDTHDEQAAQQAEQDRVDELARQNEEVRRAEHPEEFADAAGSSSSSDDDEPASAAPVAPASGTGADTNEANAASSSTVTSSSSSPDHVALADLEHLATVAPADARATIERGAAALRRFLFGGPAS